MPRDHPAAALVPAPRPDDRVQVVEPMSNTVNALADEVMNIAAETLRAAYIEDEETRDQLLRRQAQRGHDVSHAIRATVPASGHDDVAAWRAWVAAGWRR